MGTIIMLVALVMLELGKQTHIKAKNVGTAKLALHRHRNAGIFDLNKARS